MAMPLIDDRSADHVFYPDSDGEPMAENQLQAELIRTLVLGFQRLYAGRTDVLVGGDNFWYPVRGQPSVVVEPDTMVVVGLSAPPDIRTMGSYRQWEHGGRVGLVIEVLSPSNTWAEMVRKRQFYDRYGVDEYWAFDPATGALEIWVRDGEGLCAQALADEAFTSPATGVLVSVIDGELAVRDPDGVRRWLTPVEEVTRAEEKVRELEARLTALHTDT